MVKNLNILFYIRKDKADSLGNAPIYCRITVDGKRSELAIKREAPIERWVPGNEIIKGSSEEFKSINTYIDTVRTKIYDHHRMLEDANKTVTAEAIKNSYLGISTKSKSLFAIFEDHNAKVKSLVGQDFAAGTLDRYTTCLHHLRAFVLSRYNKSDFFLCDIDNEFITELDYYLRSVRKCANNTTIKYIKNFKKIIRIAIANGWLLRDPFLNYKPKLKKVDRGYLTQEELDKLAAKTFSIPRMQQVKDAFLFQCYTGLAYADVNKLKPEHIVKGADGELWISTHRTKTNSNVNVPLLPEALKILNRYKENPMCINKGVLLPVLSNQKMNAYLKEIGDLCEINKNISSHLARHTFATTVTLANGISLEAVSKMLAHSNMNTTKIYARMMDSRVSDEMQGLKSRMKNKILKIA